FNMNDWEPDKHILANNSDIYYWVIPAKVDGQWTWKLGNNEFKMVVEQKFQNIEIKLDADKTELVVNEPSLSGDKIWFIAESPVDNSSYVFHGRVDGDKISGTVQIRSGERNVVESWTAALN